MCLAHYKQVAYKLEESSMTINFSIPIYKQANEMHCLQNNANLTQKSLCLTQLVHLWPVFACSVLITVAFSPTKCFPGFIFPGWIHPGDCNVHKSYSIAWHRVHFHGNMTSIGKESPFVAVILMAACPAMLVQLHCSWWRHAGDCHNRHQSNTLLPDKISTMTWIKKLLLESMVWL